MKSLLSLLIATSTTEAREFWRSDNVCSGSLVKEKQFTKDWYSGPKGWDICEDFCKTEGPQEFFEHPKRRLIFKNNEFCCQMNTLYGLSPAGRYEQLGVDCGLH